MKCKKTKKLISILIDDELDEKRKSCLNKHLKNCCECRKESDIFIKMGKSISNEKMKVPVDFRARVWSKIEDYESTCSQKYRKLVLLPLYAAALLLLMIIGATSSLVYAYKLNIKDSATDKILLTNYIKECVLSINFTPRCYQRFLSKAMDCIHETSCKTGCEYCREVE